MKEQFTHAVKSFKSQKHINITIVKAKVETAFNNASDKEDPAWLIQWVIDNKLVCNMILLFKHLHITQLGAQIIFFVFQIVANQTMGSYFFIFIFQTLTIPQTWMIL